MVARFLGAWVTTGVKGVRRGSGQIVFLSVQIWIVLEASDVQIGVENDKHRV